MSYPSSRPIPRLATMISVRVIVLVRKIRSYDYLCDRQGLSVKVSSFLPETLSVYKSKEKLPKGNSCFHQTPRPGKFGTVGEENRDGEP